MFWIIDKINLRTDEVKLKIVHYYNKIMYL